MIDWLVRQLFKYGKLRLAIFDEVNMYNSLKHIMNDPEEMATAAAFWWEPDGWRGYSHNKDKGRYYFYDIPEHDWFAVNQELDDMEGVSLA